ncbi:YitT family protein [Clostridium sp.]|uniref:YitT family protein n=1 Tax=Clostridium sp. TaxID=1506 RepID=UPI00260859EF
MGKQKIFKDYIYILLGSFLFCAGLNWFIVPIGLYNGGTVGISQIIRTLIQSSVELPKSFDIAGIINFIINLPLLYLAYRHFGKSLFLKTVFSVVTQTILFSFIPIPQNPIINEYIAACLIGGIMAGVGVGITLRFGGTGGGADILGLYFTQKYKNFSVGKLVLIINAFIYGTCAILFELPVAIYSIIYSAVYSMVVDRIHLQNINTSVMIFTKKKDIHKKIINDLQRGTTYWKGVGGYTESDTYVVMSVLSKYEIQYLIQFLEEEDPDAFVVITEGTQIVGNYEVRV